MSERVFTSDELEEIGLYEGSADVKLWEGCGARRWSETFECVFLADDGKHYLIFVEEGLTENQDYSGYEQYPDSDVDYSTYNFTVSCPEVELYEVMEPVTKWRKVETQVYRKMTGELVERTEP